MKKVFIGLLILAAGAAVFFLLQKKNKSITGHNIQKEWIIGNWKLDSLWSLQDSANQIVGGLLDRKLISYQYDFKKDGSITKAVGDSLTKDSIRYEWMNKDQITWKEYTATTTIEVFEVSLLNKDSLLLQSKDSVALLFTKAK